MNQVHGIFVTFALVACVVGVTVAQIGTPRASNHPNEPSVTRRPSAVTATATKAAEAPTTVAPTTSGNTNLPDRVLARAFGFGQQQDKQTGNNGFEGMFNLMNQAGEFFGGGKKNKEHESDKDYSKEKKVAVAGAAAAAAAAAGKVAVVEKKVEGDDKEAGDKKELDHPSDWVKLMLNPVALLKAISEKFKLPFEKLSEKVGKGVVFGSEAVLHPFVATLKITEKVFQPDACRLKMVCQWGSHLEFVREHVLKLSSNLLEGSSHLHAFTDGIIGRDCVSAYKSCTDGESPKLNKEYEELSHSGSSSSYEHD